MKIAVCISFVPDTATKIKISSDGKSIENEGVVYILNPYDEIAVEEALRLKEKTGGETFAISLGSDNCKEAIRKALAMGIDNGILLKTDEQTDSFGTASLLADEIKNIGADIVFFGKQSVDFDNSITGQLTAGLLNFSCISVVVKFEIEGNIIKAEREIEGGREVVEAKLPAVITAQKGLNEPRYASLKGIMAAKKKIIEEKPVQVSNNLIETIKLIRPKPKQPGRIIGTDKSAVAELVNLLHNEAKVI